MSVVLAVDLGGSSLRVALVDASGNPLSLVSQPSRTDEDHLGWAEADPADWWAGIGRAAEALAASEPAAFGRIEAIAISALTRTQVFIDADGRVLRPAILWQDTRAEPLVPALKGRCPPDHPETAEIGPFHPLARLWWLAQAEPAIARSLARVLEPKDYLNLRLTGVARSDRVSMARLVAAATPGPDGRSLFAAAGIDPQVVPPLVDPAAVVGHVVTGLGGALDRLAGLPVVAMANDTWASVVGLGAMRAGRAYNLSGTTEVFGVVSEHPTRAAGLLCVDWSNGLHQLGGPSQNGADALAWLLSLTSSEVVAPTAVGAQLADLLAQPRVAEPVLFLPYLRGERVPYWDPALRGAFVGLSRRHRMVDLAWAVMEGVAMHNRVVLERAESGLGRAVAEIRFGGGGANHREWAQVKADVLGRPVILTAQDQHGLLGAAIVAWTVLGRFATLASAQQALVRTAHRFEPTADRHARYSRLYALFARATAALTEPSHALAGWAFPEPSPPRTHA